ncbi:MAG: hypothetical protein ACHQQS_02900 [Thermoanaerobaculales bacterium]
MNAADFVTDLLARGYRLRVFPGDRLRLGPRAALTPEIVETVKAHRVEVIAELHRRTREAELAATQRLDDAFAAWREHVTACPACDQANPRHRCDEGRRLADDYHLRWRDIFVVPFAGSGS